MKIIIFTLFLIVMFNVNVVAQELNKDSSNTQENPSLSIGTVEPGGEIVSVDAFGLVCDFCATAIEKVFMRKDEVSGLNVSLVDHKIIIALKNGKNLDDAEIEKLITDSGYNVKSIDRSVASN